MIRPLIYINLFIAFCIVTACNQEPKISVVRTIQTPSREAINPYLTQDEAGTAVLCWTEKDPVDSLYRLRYARFDRKSNTFGTPVTVTPSAGTTATPESMNKVAFKSDGTIIAMFGKRFLNEKNPYAGAIQYSISSNRGKSWTQARYLHSDTAHHYGRSFFDIARLNNGEIGAIWLDGRFGKAEKGSGLFFNKTEKGKGFGQDRLIAKQTCECCRTELLCDNEGKLHIAYRSILYPYAMMGKQVRDMVYTTSVNNGETFSKVMPISADNWAIEGCPHTGPSLAVAEGKVHALWFTAGGNPGLYLSQSSGKKMFSTRQPVSSKGRHPQMIALPNSRLVTIWEEEVSSETTQTSTMHHTSMNQGHHSATAASKIVVTRQVDGKVETVFATDGLTPAHHGVLAATGKGVLAAWVKEENHSSSINYALIKF